MTETDPTKARPAPATAYSYLRLSSKRQANKPDSKTYKDGFRRQIELRDKYLAANPHLTLDTRLVLHDIGVSGFTNANAASGGKGKLALFMEEVEAGRVAKGSYLLVESLDRMSRTQVSRAQAFLLALLNHGIVVVSLSDNKEYRQNGDMSQFILSIIGAARAHEESVIKATRLRATWEQKRRAAGERKLSGRCPAWLELVNGEFREKDGRFATVRKIFEYLADEYGRDRIASILNETEVPWGHGRMWHGGTVQKITDNRAVLGEYQPHRLDYEERGEIMVAKRVPVGDPIPDYYPRVISQELWDAAQRVARKRRMEKAPNAGGRLGTVISNIFGVVAVCATCKRRMNYRDRGPRSTAVLRCSGQRSGACDNAYRFPYQDTEDVVLSWLVNVDLAGGTPGEVARLSAERDKEIARHDGIMAIGANIIEKVGKGGSFAPSKLEALEVELAASKARLVELSSKIRLLKEAGGRDERQMAVKVLHDLRREKAPAGQVFAARARIRRIVHDTISGMWCYPDGSIDVITVDGGYHCFRDGFMWHDEDGIWIPSAMAIAHGGQTATKAEMARRQTWLREFYDKGEAAVLRLRKDRK